MTFSESLSHCPQSGNGVHSWVMTCANLAAKEGLSAHEAVESIKARMTRTPAPSNEVESAIEKAYRETGNKPTGICFKAIPVREKVFRDLTRNSLSCKELCGMSPVEVGSPTDLADQRRNAAMLLRRLYEPQELVWLGEQRDTLQGIKHAERWAQIIEDGGRIPSQWIPNPLDGQAHPLGNGKPSYRCDNAVSAFKYVVCECDRFPAEMQAAFWMANRNAFPLVAIIFSGGKSLHAILKSGVTSREGWTNIIEQGLFPRTLVPLGFDPATRNESRLSRMPGHYRTEKGKLQSLLWMEKP